MNGVQGVAPVSPAEIKALWWTLTYVILPAITGNMLLTLGVAKWLHESFRRRLDAVRTNEIKHLSDRVKELEQQFRDH